MMRIAPLALLALAACSTSHPNRVQSAPPPLTITAQMLGPNGELRGNVTLMQLPAGTRVLAKVGGLTPGSYAIHLHAAGACDAPDFKTAGPHFNPTAHQHGSQNPAGPHLGDLPNISVGPDGTGGLDSAIPGLVLRGGAMPLLDADGAAIVLHAAADDYRTDPSGNSGARIACGVLIAPPPHK